jgi:putative SOS response-associated peptidase YedK
MCSHYEAPAVHLLQKHFGVGEVEPYSADIWPGYTGAFIRLAADADPHDEAAPALEALPGTFGLLPHWVKDEKLARRTYNARSETVDSKPSFRAAWKDAKHCIIPAAGIYEPDWRSGKAVATRITRKDGELLSIAGLWECWRAPDGKIVHSYTMLTINADDHPFMQNYHKPTSEKRMVVILPNAQVNDWLSASASESVAFLNQYPADRLMAEGGKP